MNHTAKDSGFLASVEGLRALAVLAVLLFHLDVPGFAGGYLGVDLFFVISGFIITRNILGDIRRDRFTLRDFYIRRFRRLLPALLATVVVTLCAALLVVPPIELQKAAQSAIAAVLSFANVSFWMEAGYFDSAASTKPLLHTWSLSVEEQFYLFWPALLLVLARRRYAIAVVGALLLASLAAALAYRNSLPEAVFYLLPFRLHQLMAGALIAMTSTRLTGRVAGASTVIGAVGFLLSAVLLGALYSPAVAAVSVTLCGTLLLLGCQSAPAQRLFGNATMLWFGKRSYAIYLVHWPLIVLWKYYADFELTWPHRLLLFVCSLIAAVLLHELIEKPFRKRGEDTTALQKAAGPIIAGSLALSLAVATTLWLLEGLPSRVDPRIAQMVNNVTQETAARRKAIRFGICGLHTSTAFAQYDEGECASLDKERPNVLVIGDSMAADMYMVLAEAYPEVHFSQATAGACTALLTVNHQAGQYPTCQALNEYRFQHLAKKDYDAIILASVWRRDRIAPLTETINYLEALEKKVLVVGPRVTFRGAVPMLVSRQTDFKKINQRLHSRAKRHATLLEAMRVAVGDSRLLDIGAAQCNPQCTTIANDELVYMDALHFTPMGARIVGGRLRERFDLRGFLSETDTGS